MNNIQIVVRLLTDTDIDKKDVEAIADAITSLIQDPTLEGAAYAGRDSDGVLRRGNMPAFEVVVGDIT